MLELDISPYLGKTEKANVTLPGYVIQRIDRYVREHKVKSRSSFLADAALEKLVRSCGRVNGCVLSAGKTAYLSKHCLFRFCFSLVKTTRYRPGICVVECLICK